MQPTRPALAEVSLSPAMAAFLMSEPVVNNLPPGHEWIMVDVAGRKFAWPAVDGCRDETP